LLVVHSAVFYGFSRSETPPPHAPLAGLPAIIGEWALATEGRVEKEIQDLLKADDLLSRVYQERRGRQAVSLFVAYFNSQRTGVSPHSPKNCLPGSGWAPSQAGTVSISVPGRANPITVNYYLVSRGEAQSVVLYWYQSRGRVIASEYAAKFYLVADAIRYNRTDTALVRVVAPVAGGDQEAALVIAKRFVADCFPALRPFLPG
jgi:EpsI family protein